LKAIFKVSKVYQASLRCAELFNLSKETLTVEYRWAAGSAAMRWHYKSSLGADISNLRVHTGETTSAAAKAVDAYRQAALVS